MTLKAECRCFMMGHEKDWDKGFFGPTWRCRRCGKEGNLESHSRMTGLEWLTVIIPTIVVVAVVLFLARGHL